MRVQTLYGDFVKEQVVEEINRFQRNVSATNATTEAFVTWITKLSQFIVKWDFSESIPILFLMLQYVSTIRVPVVSCNKADYQKFFLINFF